MKILQGFQIKSSKTLVLQDLQDTTAPEVTGFLKCTVPVIEDRIYQVLSAFDLPDTSFPSVTFSFDESITGFRLFQCNNVQSVIDLDASDAVYEKDEDGSVFIKKINRLVLDKDRLGELQDNQQYIIRTAESAFLYLYSQPVIDKLSALNSADFKWYPLEEWNDSIVFHDPEM